MGEKEILDHVLRLKPQEKFLLVESILESLDHPDKTLDDIWAAEAQKRLQAYRDGKIATHSMEEVFKEI